DAIDLLQPDTTLLISQNAEKTLDFTEIYNYDKIFVVFPGIDNNGFSKIDQSLGNYVKMLDNASDLGPVSLASFAMTLDKTTGTASPIWLYCSSLLPKNM
ncbi:hypothetical protein DJ522_07465, partial [Sulfolobus sp. F3]